MWKRNKHQEPRREPVPLIVQSTLDTTFTPPEEGDEFRYKSGSAPLADMEDVVYTVTSVASEGRYVSFLAPGQTDWQVADVRDIELINVKPKLTERMQEKAPWELDARVQELFYRADYLINPPRTDSGDWEKHHSVQDEVYEDAFQLMKEFPEDRDAILAKMLQVVALRIPRW